MQRFSVRLFRYLQNCLSELSIWSSANLLEIVSIPIEDPVAVAGLLRLQLRVGEGLVLPEADEARVGPRRGRARACAGRLNPRNIRFGHGDSKTTTRLFCFCCVSLF